ncbi:VCBS repeat-containing protein, partial [candidate division KSB1 bacterium]|nr:VCBS repeat-containing protein [candidate division KSB1 bacterium]
MSHSFPPFIEIPFENNNTNPIYIAWGDYDNDNLVDLYICNYFSQPNQLLKNKGNGEFLDVTEKTQIKSTANSVFALWVDLNNDNWLDLFLINYKYENQLFQNNGNGTFQEIYSQTGLCEGHPAIIDIDSDGLLDIYLARGRKLYASSLKNQLFYNSGDFKFLAAPEKSFLTKDGYFDWPNWIDPENDYKPDLFVANTTSDEAKQNHIFRNNGDSTFNQFNLDGLEMGITGDNQFGDLDNDGDQDLIIFEFKGRRFCCCENDNGKYVQRTVSTEFMKESDGHEQEFWESLKLIDFDSDGRLDLQVRIHPIYSENALWIRFYRNLGNFNFVEMENPFSNPAMTWMEDVSWADIDND